MQRLWLIQLDRSEIGRFISHQAGSGRGLPTVRCALGFVYVERYKPSQSDEFRGHECGCELCQGSTAGHSKFVRHLSGLHPGTHDQHLSGIQHMREDSRTASPETHHQGTSSGR